MKICVKTMRCPLVAVLIAATIMVSVPQPCRAGWHRSGELPGMMSTETLVLVGVASLAVGVLIYMSARSSAHVRADHAVAADSLRSRSALAQRAPGVAPDTLLATPSETTPGGRASVAPAGRMDGSTGHWVFYRSGPERFGVSVSYMPRWATGNVKGGEPDYHFFLAGLRYMPVPRWHLNTGIGFYLNGDVSSGPDFVPVLVEGDFDLLAGYRARLFCGAQVVTYVPTNRYGYTNVSSMVSPGLVLGFSARVVPNVNLLIRTGYSLAPNKKWSCGADPQRHVYPSCYSEGGRTDFGGLHGMGGVEFGFGH